MAAPEPLPAQFLQSDDFLEVLHDEDLVYFLCNIGDGDAQLVLLPATEDPPASGGAAPRRVLIVDAGQTKKLPRLLKSLGDEGLLVDEAAQPVALLVATHPHSDHIRGMKELLQQLGEQIAEFWDPGYYHTSAAYLEMMAEVERLPHLLYAQPTSGLRRWIGDTAITVLSPAIHLRNRFDTYGTEINDSSISLRIEFPAGRVVQRDDDRVLISDATRNALVLGADAQTLSWSYVLTDFPRLHPSDSAAARAIAAATGADLLRGQILKVAHHGSKHGVNLELVERIAPALTLVSSTGGGGSYRFPHTIAQELVREALEPTTSSGATHRKDHELGIFYTSDRDDTGPTSGDGQPLGSIAVVIRPNGSRTLWRFRDEPDDAIDLQVAVRWTGP